MQASSRTAVVCNGRREERRRRILPVKPTNRAPVFLLLLTPLCAFGAVPHGSDPKAVAYYQQIATEIGFKTSASILESTLGDVLVYVGYDGLSAQDIQRIPSPILMDPRVLGQPCAAGSACETAVSDPAAFRKVFGTAPLRTGDILAARFFAPKIVNVNDPPSSRQLGWRKLVRLRARRGSAAAGHQIQSAIILFNFFTDPNVKPFGPGADSVNTQVMLTSTSSRRTPIYWLDYGPLAAGGKLSKKLDASFDAADFTSTAGPGAPQPGIQPYFVPDGCNACHGDNRDRPLVNYLDTDHWFDRVENDFPQVRQMGTPVLFDAGTDDPSSPQFVRAFDAIREFNEEAERQAAVAQPNAFHRKAAQTWLKIHENNIGHIPPVERAIPSATRWTSSSGDKEALEMLNRYCFRCHGTIKFNVFDKGEVQSRHAKIRSHLQPTADQLKLDPFYRMPSDRILSPGDIARLLQLIP